MRTTNNLAGCAYGCAVIEKLCVKFGKIKEIVGYDSPVKTDEHIENEANL